MMVTATSDRETTAEMKVVEAIRGAPNREEEKKPGLSVFSLDSPGGRKRNAMMTKIVYNTRGTPACRVLAFV